MSLQLFSLDQAALELRLVDLAGLLSATVSAGASVGFMQPLNPEQARQYWQEEVLPELQSGRRRVWVAERDGRCLGTVQLITAMPANQAHRCEIAKMMVHPEARRQGIARALMQAVLAAARAEGRTLATLDTRRGDAAEPLYRMLGFEVAGVIPGYARDPDGRALHDTVYMYRRL